MSEIQNKDYMTIGLNGVSVGGNPATLYHEAVISQNLLPMYFKALKRQAPNYIRELHCLASETIGVKNKPGNPSPIPGAFLWTRVQSEDGRVGPWVFVAKGGQPSNYAFECLFNIRYSQQEIQSAMLRPLMDEATLEKSLLPYNMFNEVNEFNGVLENLYKRNNNR